MSDFASRQASIKETEEYSDFKASVTFSPLASANLISFSNSSFYHLMEQDVFLENFV